MFDTTQQTLMQIDLKNQFASMPYRAGLHHIGDRGNFYIHPTGEITPTRKAEFWHKISDSQIQCDLCYRFCKLVDGQKGVCQYRINRAGIMTIPHHGTVSDAVPVTHVTDVFRKPNQRIFSVGGVYCNAKCSFCASDIKTQRPDELPWAVQERYPSFCAFTCRKAVMPEEMVIQNAIANYCTQVFLGTHEPMMSWEYTYDLARLAKKSGLEVCIYTNGFSTIPTIEKLAPFVDVVNIGFKGGGHPGFYARQMKSTGAELQARRAVLAWKNAGVFVFLADLIPPESLLSDNELAEAQRDLYSWFVDELGPNTPFTFGGVLNPILLNKQLTEESRIIATRKRAKDAGLNYAVLSQAGEKITCHHCKKIIVDMVRTDYCEMNARNGKCDFCGGDVPII